MNNDNSSSTNTILLVLVIVLLVGGAVWFITGVSGPDNSPGETANINVSIPASSDETGGAQTGTE